MKRSLFSLVMALSILASSLPLMAGEIHTAIEEGDAARIREIIKNNPEAINERADNQFQELPIHMAAATGNLEIVRILIEAGTPVDAGDSDNSTALGIAAMRRNVELVTYLLEQGANVNHRDRKADTPISFACFRGNEAVIQILLDAGADLYYRSPDGETLLHRACQRNIPMLVQHIIENGIDLNTQTGHGATPLGHAAMTRNPDLVTMLIEAGAMVNPKIEDDQMSPLAYTTWRDAVECARVLLDNGARVNKRMHGETTPLISAVQHSTAALVRLLIEYEAEVNLYNEDGMTALAAAAGKGDAAIVEALLAAGADTDLGTDNCGRTALQVAAIRGYSDISSKLLDAGASVNSTGECGISAAQFAAYYGNTGVVDVLAAKGAGKSGKKIDRSLAKVGKLGNKEAAIYFLGHSAWAIKTRNHMLVFDYFQDGTPGDNPSLCNGCVNPAELAGNKVTVFASHHHGDHYWPGIFEWGEQVEDITYFLGHQPRDTVPAYTFMPPRMQEQFGDIKLTTVKATDAGVAMMIEVDGLTIFHGGDHANGRIGLMDEFTDEIDFLAENCPRPDICIMGIRGCSLGTPPQVKEGVEYTLAKLNPRTFLPMHASADGKAYREFNESIRGQFEKIEMAAPGNRGDHFIYKKGKLKDPKPFTPRLATAQAEKACDSSSQSCGND